MPGIDGSILTPDGWIAGRVAFADRIEAVDGRPTATPAAPFVLPGFVDLHVHGGGGGDMMAGARRDPDRCARCTCRHGTTSMLATSVTAPAGRDRGVPRRGQRARWRPSGRTAARILGAHLEGPFINPGKLGAQPPFAIPADPETMRGWLDRGGRCVS